MEEKKAKEVLARLAVCGAGVAVAVASRAAETSFAAPLGLLAIVLISWGVHRVSSPTKWLYFSGIFFHALAFYWLPATINLFGGFPYAISLLLFVLYILLSSLQFALAGYLFRFLNRGLLQTTLLAFPAAWILGELFFPRMFPWSLIHPLIDWEIISAHAQYIGAWGLSFLVLWIVGVVTSWPISQSVMTKRAAAFALFLLIVGGLFSISKNSEQEGSKFNVALIQGNVDATDFTATRQPERELEPYIRLSQAAINSGAELLIWPESAISVWADEKIKNFSLPYLRQPLSLPVFSVPLLFGGLSYRLAEGETSTKNAKYFNSTFLIDHNKNVQGVYHKKILMPFGEYLPFADTFPQLKKLSPQSGDFTKGDLDEPLAVSVLGVNTPIKFGVLICYEDLVSSIARESALAGSNILVNLTNDIWYGKTAAPYQHHLLARWRAVEVSRYLLRSTNTGYSAVVDWRGKTIAALPIFSEGSLIVQVGLSDKITWYAKSGDWPLYFLLLVIGAIRFSPYSREK